MKETKYRLEITDGVDKWFRKHVGTAELARVKLHLRNLSLGNFGVTRQIEGGLYEKKINTRGGIRIYYFIKLKDTIKILGIGNKSTQDRDIIKAKKLWQIEVKGKNEMA